MSDYTKTVDFAAKDALLTGNPAKLVKGTEIDTEFNNIATAVATKIETSDAIGTPTSGVLTNCTGLPVSTGISGLGTGVATFLATPSSANLASAITDETGSGALVFANTPTLVTPLLGTPTSGVLTNCTGTASGLTAGGNALLAGSASQTFSVATATATTHAVTLAQLETITTPTLTLSGSVSDPTTPVTATATYVVSGKFATVAVQFINVTTTGISGDLRITGLPNATVGTGMIGEVMMAGFGTAVASALVEGSNISIYDALTLVKIASVAGPGRYLYVTIKYRITA